MNNPLMTAEAVAEFLNLQLRTVYELAKLGQAEPDNPRGLPFMLKVGGSWRARPEDVKAWVEAQIARS